MRWRWIVLCTGAASLTATIERISNANFLPFGWPLLRQIVNWFILPGEIAWWATMGSLFQGFPVTPGAVLLFLVANTAFWSVLIWSVVWAGRWLWRYRARKNIPYWPDDAPTR